MVQLDLTIWVPNHRRGQIESYFSRLWSSLEKGRGWGVGGIE